MIPEYCSDCFYRQEELNTTDFLERACPGCMQTPYTMQQTMLQNPYTMQPNQLMPYGMPFPMDYTSQYMQPMQPQPMQQMQPMQPQPMQPIQPIQPYGQTQVIPSQQSPQDTMEQTQQIQTNIAYMQGYLATQIGKRMRIDFLFGTNIIQDREGTLIEVGISYLVINETETKLNVMCDMYSIKFVRIFE